MLFYYTTGSESVDEIKDKGIEGEVLLHSIERLDFNTQETILVIDPLKLDVADKEWYSTPALRTSDVPVSAIRNLDPCQNPRLVIAGGGFLLRQVTNEKEIALIFRREKWDIPKGKLDPGESYEECAVREVQEELGIQDILCKQPLGSTWHCYERKGRFCVKRTYWYEMETSDTVFHPQEDEDIEEVAWFSWSAAKAIVDFPLFRLHMEYVEAQIMK